MNMTQLLILLLQLLTITRMSDLSGSTKLNQNPGVEVNWQYIQTVKELTLREN